MSLNRSLIPLLAALALTSCGSSTSDRDQALSALDRATQAAGLETEMASLVADIPSDPNQKQGKNINASVKEIDSQAETILASTNTGKAYDEKITEAVNETRGAGDEITKGVGNPGKLGKARTKAVGRLTSSNKNLGQATNLVGEDLADEQGNLTSEDAEAVEQTLVAVNDSEQAVVAAGEDVQSSECAVEIPHLKGSFPVEVENGDLDCVEATEVFRIYYDPSTVKMGSGGSATIGEWYCISSSPGDIERGETTLTRCQREKDGAVIIDRLPEGESPELKPSV